MEHISQYLAQLGEIVDEPAFKVRFFPLSLSGPAFSWFASLPHNSIKGWGDLEPKFHHYFDSGIMEKGITDLIDVRQRNNEPTLHYLQRFKEVRNQCYSLTLSVIPDFKDKTRYAPYVSLRSQISHIATNKG